MLEFFNILIGCFETRLSSLLIKILPIHIMSQAIVLGIHFSSFFLVGILVVFGPNFKVYVKFTYSSKLFKEGTFVLKKWGFFASKDSQQFTTLGDYKSRYVNTEKLEMPMPIQKQKHPAESQETQQGRLPKKP